MWRKLIRNMILFFLSVRHGLVKEAVETLRKNNIKGTLVFFCNFWDTRKEVQEWAGDYDYILAFPTAGGHMQEDHLMVSCSTI